MKAGTAIYLAFATTCVLAGSVAQAGFEGALNTFYGVNTGPTTTGSYNAFFGDDAGTANTTGFNNVFIGAYAGWKNSTGRNNLFLGNSTGSANTSGSYTHSSAPWPDTRTPRERPTSSSGSKRDTTT